MVYMDSKRMYHMILLQSFCKRLCPVFTDFVVIKYEYGKCLHGKIGIAIIVFCFKYYLSSQRILLHVTQKDPYYPLRIVIK